MFVMSSLPGTSMMMHDALFQLFGYILSSCTEYRHSMRMILAPTVLYFIAYAIDIHIFHPRGQTRPLAFWAPAMIVAAMPTANNMHLVGKIHCLSSCVQDVTIIH